MYLDRRRIRRDGNSHSTVLKLKFDKFKNKSSLLVKLREWRTTSSLVTTLQVTNVTLTFLRHCVNYYYWVLNTTCWQLTQILADWEQDRRWWRLSSFSCDQQQYDTLCRPDRDRRCQLCHSTPYSDIPATQNYGGCRNDTRQKPSEYWVTKEARKQLTSLTSYTHFHLQRNVTLHGLSENTEQQMPQKNKY